ncbi:glutaredoxin 3 [Alteromonas sp. ASW11-130]|uniref:glutaredoxin 3 n=1 Tax=Alteromonas sp. ASW11-130 TaxID=3015775 RepID=UPI0022423F95|nr:glutaredoxin 3 [Alteromonas sp. ASW11-130]MCW8090895.1 glutaredoxin 3 [Alteromonas sp. ASW11-130]
MANIEIYTKGYCPYCHRAKALFDEKGVGFKEYAIDVQPELRDEMISRAHGGWTVPQIFINEQHIGGCDDLVALDMQNKLDDLLAE